MQSPDCCGTNSIRKCPVGCSGTGHRGLQWSVEGKKKEGERQIGLGSLNVFSGWFSGAISLRYDSSVTQEAAWTLVELRDATKKGNSHSPKVRQKFISSPAAPAGPSRPQEYVEQSSKSSSMQKKASARKKSRKFVFTAQGVPESMSYGGGRRGERSSIERRDDLR